MEIICGKCWGLGDGACYVGKNRKKVCVYYTASKNLKNDFEEILLKAGWTYHTSVRSPREGFIDDRVIKKENRVPCFEIRLRRNNKVQIKSLQKKEIPYKGKIFCLQLSKYHNFYVRRNGTGYFTGNSLAGPVTAGAVFIPKKFKLSPEFKKIKDSKKLTPKRREEFCNILKKHPGIKWGIGNVSEKIIDKINIFEATKLAMKKAVDNLEKKLKRKIDFLILDGNFKINSCLPQKPIIKADNKVFSVMSASIIAKVTRDKLMRELDKKYPKYKFAVHKGYPTKLHRKLLKKHGPCKIHRKTFRPVFLHKKTIR